MIFFCCSRDEPKGVEGAENDEVEDKETGVEGEEAKKVVVETEPKEKASEVDEKDVKEKGAKKEEPAKKVVKKEEKKPDKKIEVKEEKKSGAEAKKKEAGKSLWVSNLSSMTRAADLKTRFTQYGKVRGDLCLSNRGGRVLKLQRGGCGRGIPVPGYPPSCRLLAQKCCTVSIYFLMGKEKEGFVR